MAKTFWLSGIGLLIALFGLLAAEPAEAAPLPGGVVGFGTAGTCTANALHTRLAGGGAVSFNCGGPATIVLSATEIISLNTSIEGGGVITLSGGSAVGILDVEGGVVTLSGLTLADGFSKAGGAVLNNGRQLTIRNSTFTNNQALVFGGAIFSGFPLTITVGTFYSNTADQGGALYSDGPLTIVNTLFARNQATSGGAVVSLANLSMIGTAFLQNTAGSVVAGSAPNRPSFAVEGVGGGLYNLGAAVIQDGDFLYNNAAAGGGAIFSAPGASLSVGQSRLLYNAGFVGGGAIFSRGGLTVNETTFTANQVNAGLTGGLGGALLQDAPGTALVANSTFTGNVAAGGGGLVVSSSLTLRNSTFTANFGLGGGAVFVPTGTLTVTNSTFAGNQAASGGALDTALGVIRVKNSLLASNGGGNCLAPVTSLGHNLDDANTCGLSASGDLTNTNPLLGPLADNGGQTRTMALLPGSPAINHGDNSGCPATDQRGFLRVAGCDIGAFEFAYRALLPLVRR